MICRPTIAHEGESFVFVDDRGNAFVRPIFDHLWHHIVDHSSYKGLNVTGHSVCISGATARHAEKMELREIMRLGAGQIPQSTVI